MDNKETITKAATIFKLLGNVSKLTILSLLAKEEANVTTIVEKTGIEQSNVSHHLKTLKDQRLLSSRREGKTIVYFPNDHHVYEIIEQVFAHVNETSD